MLQKVRVHELAKDLQLTSKDIITILEHQQILSLVVQQEVHLHVIAVI